MRLWMLLGLLALFAAGIAYRWQESPAPVPGPDVQGPAARGLELARARGCVACHSLDGNGSIGPSWLGLYGATRQFGDGSSLLADEAYLRQAMREPAARVVAGYDNLMLPAGLTVAEEADIIALIRALAPVRGQ